MSYYLPILLVVLSNTVYQICGKSTPKGVNTFASLVAVYAVAMLSSLGIYFVTAKEPNLLRDFKALNWTSLVMGISIIGLEAGLILTYRAGWGISTGPLVQSLLLALVLLGVGAVLFREPITLRKGLGVLVCLGGLYLVNG